MTVAVTGATGHLGANLVRTLLAAGRRVRVVIRSHKAALDGLEVEEAHADVGDRRALEAAFEGASVVYHLAARISIDGSQGGLVERVNVDGAENAAEAALRCGVKRLVYFSSIHAFDLEQHGRTVDERSARAGGRHPAYDRSKAAGERAVRRVVERGLDAVIVHPSGCIGPFDFEPSRMGRVLLDLARGRLPALVQGGFHWVDARDVVAGAIAAEERGRAGESYILSGRWAAMAEIARIAAGVTSSSAPRLCVPLGVAALGAPVMTLLNRTLGVDPLYTAESLRAMRANPSVSTDKARRELGFAARPLEETIADTYAWFAERGRLAPSAA